MPAIKNRYYTNLKTKEMNEPYIKQYDENGYLIPLEKKVNSKGQIIASYGSKDFGPNRKERNAKEGRFKGNKKGVSLTVAGSFRYTRIIQEIRDKKTGLVVKRIQQYILN